MRPVCDVGLVFISCAGINTHPVNVIKFGRRKPNAPPGLEKHTSVFHRDRPPLFARSSELVRGRGGPFLRPRIDTRIRRCCHGIAVWVRVYVSPCMARLAARRPNRVRTAFAILRRMRRGGQEPLAYIRDGLYASRRHETLAHIREAP